MIISPLDLYTQTKALAKRLLSERERFAPFYESLEGESPMSFEHGERVMFKTGEIFLIGRYLGSFQDLSGHQRSIVQTGEVTMHAPLSSAVDIYDVNSPKLKDRMVREERILPPLQSSKY